MNCHSSLMSTLNGQAVRHRMAELNLGWEAISRASGIPEGTLKNTTRDRNPDPIRSLRVGALLEALNPTGHKRRGLPTLRLSDILLGGGTDGVPDDPPSKEQDQETNTGPGRDAGGGTGPGKSGEKKSPRRVKGVVAA